MKAGSTPSRVSFEGGIGSLFRYSRRYDEEFRCQFASGYIDAGGRLPAGWCLSARLLDATRLVRLFGEKRDMSGVFSECQSLLSTLLRDAEQGD